MFRIVLLRHGESVWNRENRFTGWTDVDLSQKGLEEAHRAGEALRREGFAFDAACTSLLKRAVRTLWIVQDELDLMWIPVYKSWRLNERHYGALQGLGKSEMAAKFGEKQVHIWRRSYDAAPPPLSKDDKRYPGFEQKYAEMKAGEIPLCESLKDTVARFLPYWNGTIAPVVKSGKRVLISAHGNSLRALVKHLDNVSDGEIAALNIPTGIPLVYELDGNLKPERHYYLGNQEEIKKVVESVVNQGKVK